MVPMMEDYKLSKTGNTVVAKPVYHPLDTDGYRLPPQLGETVLYRCRSGDDDRELRWNHVADGNAVYRPAIVVRVWETGLLNLRVLADGPPEKDAWRTSVPHVSSAIEGSQAWQRLNE